MWSNVLPIPQIVDEYNHNMNHINQADYLQANYKTMRDHRLQKGSKTLFFWLFNMLMVNAYLLSFHSDNNQRFTNQKFFRK